MRARVCVYLFGSENLAHSISRGARTLASLSVNVYTYILDENQCTNENCEQNRETEKKERYTALINTTCVEQ